MNREGDTLTLNSLSTRQYADDSYIYPTDVSAGFLIERAPDMPRTDCSIKSLNKTNPPQWILGNFTYSGQPTQSNWTLIRFSVINSVNGFQMWCDASLYTPDRFLQWHKEDGLVAPPAPADYVFPVAEATWFPCDRTSNVGEKWPTTSDLHFSVDKRYDMIAFNESWACDDTVGGTTK